MERLRCFDGPTGYAAENQNAHRARLLQTRRSRKSFGRFRRTLSICDGAADGGARSMDTDSKDKILSGDGSRLASAEQRLSQLGITLPAPPEPFGIYAEAVQTGNLLFLTGMLPTVGREAK